MKNKKELIRIKRHKRLLARTQSSRGRRPRVIIRRSLNNIFAQIVDDISNKVLFSLSTFNKEIGKDFPSGGNVKAAVLFGEIFAKKAKEKGIEKIVFDRAGFLYHGRIKAFADGLRKGGLQF